MAIEVLIVVALGISAIAGAAALYMWHKILGWADQTLRHWLEKNFPKTYILLHKISGCNENISIH